ncbi:MAG: hypothetical protein KY463_10580 [Actinobacteria bacterium]|nr:hypothetical protein [Actinomycetota bacterium]
MTLLAAATPAGAAGPPEKTCPPGFNLGALSLEQRLQLPKVQAALEDGIVTLEQIKAGAAAIDKNGNGLLCVQDIPQANNAAPAAGFEYFYNLSDDNAAARR